LDARTRSPFLDVDIRESPEGVYVAGMFLKVL
jgi:hypothetical protein